MRLFNLFFRLENKYNDTLSNLPDIDSHVFLKKTQYSKSNQHIPNIDIKPYRRFISLHHKNEIQYQKDK